MAGSAPPRDAASAAVPPDALQRASYQAMVECSHVPMYVSRDGTFLYLNPAAVLMFGAASAADLVGRAVLDRVHPEFHDSARRRLRVLAGDVSSTDLVESRLLRMDGTPVDVEIEETSILFEGVLSVHAAVRDITARVAERRALRESEARFRSIFAEAPMGVALVDSLTGAFLEVNEKYAAILGRTAKEVEALDWMCITHPDDLAADVSFMAQLNRGEIPGFSMTKRYRKPDGSWVRVRLTVARTAAEVGTPRHLAMIEDITLREAAEAVVRESEMKLRAIFSTMSEGVALNECVYDEHGEMVDYRIVEVNDAYFDHAELAERDVIGRLATELYGMSPASIREFWREHRKRNITQRIEMSSPVSARTFQVATSPFRDDRFVTTFFDITASKAMDARMRLVNAALEAATSSIVITNGAGITEWVNATFTEKTGYSLDEAIGRTPGNVVGSGVQSAAFFAEMWETILAGRVWRGEVVNRRKDGTLFSEEMTITPVRDAAGELSHFIAVNEDLSVRKLLEEQLRQSQKMESVGRLAGGVAHDFNNMLSVIIGHAEMALRRERPGTTVYEDLTEIFAAASRSANLTRQLLAFARRQPITPRVIDLNDAVADSLRMLQRLIGEHIALEWQPQPALWPVLMDPSQLDQILANLCVNARDAIGTVGTLSLATGNRTVDEEFCRARPEARPGDYVWLRVHDDGSGMDADVLARVFEPFFTTKPQGEGTGLGLSMVYGAVRQNEGFIDVCSEPGIGTTFDVYLPRSIQPAHARHSVGPDVAAPRGTETILLVEDEAAILRLVSASLESLGYRVLPAGSPMEAGRLARALGGAVDLLLSDVVMPGMSGPELARRLRAEQPTMQHLFMSGYASDFVTANAALPSDAHVIAKPFALTALAAKVRSVLDGRA